jgi:sortase A
MLYPVVSDWWNSKVQTKAVANYDKVVAEMDDNKSDEIFQKAHDYNNLLNSLEKPFTEYDRISGYNDALDISGTGIMGYITIPAINSKLVIYHSTSDEVLNIAAGHLQGTSLPVGGEGTHSVISAHRGLPTAKLFSELDKLVVGDTFTITILDEVLTYQVEDIYIIEPHEVDKLLTIEGKDYVTLMTCTPYGINSHRLLIRSKRIETAYQFNGKVTADAGQVDPLLVVPAISSPFVLILLIMWIFGGKTRKKPAENLFGVTNNDEKS